MICIDSSSSSNPYKRYRYKIHHCKITGDFLQTAECAKNITEFGPFLKQNFPRSAERFGPVDYFWSCKNP